MISIKGLTKKYSENVVLDNINFKFPSKGLFIIKGPSGGGKTTLLNIIGNLIIKYQGYVLLNKKIVAKKENNSYLKENLGYVFQNFNLIDSLTVFQNLKIVFSINNDLKFKKSLLDEVVCKYKIEHIKNKRVKYLSNGEKQRVAIARATLAEKKVLLFDEPTSSLNKENSQLIWKYLKEISIDKLVIVITHDKYSFNLTPNILSLINGKLVVTNEHKNEENEINEEKYNSYKVKKCSLYLLSFYHLKINFKRTLIIAFSLSLLVAVSFLSKDMFLIINKKISEDINQANNYSLITKPNMDNNFSFDEFKSLLPSFNNTVKNQYVEVVDEKLYDISLALNSFEIGNGFILSKTKYVDYYLNENEVYIGGNRENLCNLFKISLCTADEVNIFLFNKDLIIKYESKTFTYKIIGFFEDDDYTIYSNRKYFNRELIYELFSFEENYFFEVPIEKNRNFFQVLNSYNYLSANLHGVSTTSYFYKIEKVSNLFFQEDEIKQLNNDYIYCINLGYNCLENFQRGKFSNVSYVSSLSSIIENPTILFTPFNNYKIGINEVIISSKLSKDLNVSQGEYLTINILDTTVSLLIMGVFESQEYIFYHNSIWSYDFFKNSLSLNDYDLRSNLLFFKSKEVIPLGYKVDNISELILEQINNFLLTTKKYVNYFLFFINLSSFIFIVSLQQVLLIESQKYFGLLKVLGANKYSLAKIIFVQNIIMVNISILITAFIYITLKYLSIKFDFIIEFNLLMIIQLVRNSYILGLFSSMFPLIWIASKGTLSLIKGK